MSAISDVKVNKKQVGKPGPHGSANNGDAKKKRGGLFQWEFVSTFNSRILEREAELENERY